MLGEAQWRWLGLPYYDANFGVIDIDWAKEELILQVQNGTGRVVLAANIHLKELVAGH